MIKNKRKAVMVVAENKLTQEKVTAEKETSDKVSLGITRRFTNENQDVYELIDWDIRESKITNYKDGSVAFEQQGVEVPSSWSLNATNILAQKYFRGNLGEPERENSLKQVADRIADTIANWGLKDGYFDSRDEKEIFAQELKYLLITQRAAFNSPVWFNIGVKDVPQQASACFILSVEDSMRSILNWYTEEGFIFKGGSGAGVNLSKIRGSNEPLAGGGTASGPVSFMRGADASAGTIKSGGKTRRAAKMVILDVDHPDIEEFIWCKANEEKKARVLAANGFDMDLDGKDIHSIQYQNANNSVRVSDEFMQAVVDDKDWALRSRVDGTPLKVLKARELFRQIAKATWECADPGMQFDTTINKWHTAHATGRINASNPCSEYMHIDNSACNLASINLLKYLNPDDTFDIEGFKHSVEVVFTAQEILVGNADYPTEKIGENSRKFRQLGIGYANLGALLMAQGMPYDSDEGRSLAAAITAVLTGVSYETSAKLAKKMGPFEGYEENKQYMDNVLVMHRQAVDKINSTVVPENILNQAKLSFDNAIEVGRTYGVRNAQASVLAPTGTIGLLMDCDTTGVEPDLGLVKTKKLVGGGTMSIVNQTIPRALNKLGYDSTQIDDITSYIKEQMTIVGAPHLDPKHLPVFACSMGDNTIHYMGHVKMMGSVQPFISGAISKTVNMPEDATVEDVENLHIEAWKLGIKAIAIYRDNCKVAQPLATTKKDSSDLDETIKDLEHRVEMQTVIVKKPERERLPRRRRSSTFAFRVADCEGYVTVGEYADGRPGEIFMKVSKQGSTLAGIMDAFSISVSLGLQHGVPLATFVNKYTNMRFEPAGITDDPDLRIATSLIDYIFRRLAIDYLTLEERSNLGILTSSERTQQLLPGMEYQVNTSGDDPESYKPIVESKPEIKKMPENRDAPYCYQCGNAMQRAGSCYVCSACGTTSGCS
jgi:ribonucleoside-diphosphate reductase alpha chain